MACVSRFLYSNLVQTSTYTLTASSADQNHPVAWLRNHLLGKPWRSALGWTIYAGFNDKIDFNRGGVKVATITAGTYATSTDLCAAIVTALEAADATPVWASSYAAGVFTISSDLAFVLLCGSGANLATSAFKSLGYIESGPGATDGSDTGSTVIHAAGFASYQSTHFVGLDLLTTSPSPTTGAAFIVGHNISATGGAYVKRNDTSIVSAASAGTSSTLAGTTSGKRGIFWSAVTARRFWTLVIEDCQNSTGYAEVPVWFLGTYGQPTYTYAQQNPRQSRELSSVAYGASGAHFHVQRAAGGSWQFVFEDEPVADLTILQALRDAAPVGKAWLFATDATSEPLTRTYYGFISTPMVEDPTGPTTTSVSFSFEEILA